MKFKPFGSKVVISQKNSEQKNSLGIIIQTADVVPHIGYVHEVGPEVNDLTPGNKVVFTAKFPDEDAAFDTDQKYFVIERKRVLSLIE